MMLFTTLYLADLWSDIFEADSRVHFLMLHVKLVLALLRWECDMLKELFSK